jgi:hypothetical protein
MMDQHPPQIALFKSSPKELDPVDGLENVKKPASIQDWSDRVRMSIYTLCLLRAVSREVSGADRQL